jgi:hypothetical protein
VGSKELLVIHPSRKVAELPFEVEDVFREFRTCEMSTLARDGTPITWPTLPFWRPDEGRFMITTSISLTQKVFNVRRTPCVSLLFSDPTASGLKNPPAVLVQADADAPDEMLTSVDGFEDELRRSYRRQPASRVYRSNALLRYFMDWYYMRLVIHVTPRRILWWPRRDFSQAPFEMEPDHVG